MPKATIQRFAVQLSCCESDGKFDLAPGHHQVRPSIALHECYQQHVPFSDFHARQH